MKYLPIISIAIFFLYFSIFYCPSLALTSKCPPRKNGHGETLCELLEKEALEERKMEEAKRKSGFEGIVQKISYKVEDMKLDLELFSKWLVSPQNVEEMLKVFVYMTRLDRPICIALETINGLDQKGNLLEGIHRMSKKMIEGEGGSRNGRRVAYMFGQNGVVPLFIENGLKCEESLEEPEQVGTFLQQMVIALENHQGDRAFDLILGTVLAHLKDANFDGKFANLVKRMHGKWANIRAEISIKSIGQGMKRFAVWLFAPSHIHFFIKIVIYITNLDGPITLSLAILSAFGLDLLLADYAMKMGIKMIENGVKKEVALWAFGPNGVIPLFLRNGKTTNKEMPYVDPNGVAYSEGTIAKWKMAMEGERQFLEKIIGQIIERKGHPMHELMDRVVEDLGAMKGYFRRKMHEKWEKIGRKWEIVKETSLKDVQNGLKKFVCWMITPEHVNNVVKLVLTITKMDVPVYLTLEVLEAFKVTDKLMEMFKLAREQREKVEFFRRHRHMAKTVDFMIGENGLIPLFLESGQMDDEEGGYGREARIRDESSMLKAIIRVAIDNPGNAIGELFDFLAHKFTSKTFLLEVFQKWNKLSERFHRRFREKHEELKEMKRKELVERRYRILLGKYRQTETQRRKTQAKANWKIALKSIPKLKLKMAETKAQNEALKEASLVQCFDLFDVCLFKWQRDHPKTGPNEFVSPIPPDTKPEQINQKRSFF